MKNHFDRSKESRLFQMADYIRSLDNRIQAIERKLEPKKRGRPRKHPEQIASTKRKLAADLKGGI